MAEVLLKAELKSRGFQGITVASAGISPKSKQGINEKTVQVLEEHGLTIERTCARRLTERMMKEAYAIVCMSEKQKEYLMDARWQAMRKAGEENFDNNVYSFYEITGYEIVDPYGKDIDCYRYVFELFNGGMAALIEKLRLKEVAKITQKKRGMKRENQ